ncbi:MAG: response regulator transcription factor [Firmicutes bacterium]|nr:response regulator transcription factor [Bacillota bacterium]
MEGRILLADDEPEIHELLTPLLTREGLTVVHAYDGPETIRLARLEPPDALVLDVMLPGLDGVEVCRELRRTHTFPILFLSARGEEVDKLVGLAVGGDDYITKPFSPRELVARVKAQIRRRRIFDTPTSPPPAPVQVGGLVIDPGTAEVRRPDGQVVTLTALELAVLLTLARTPGRIWTKRQLYEAAWGQPYLGDDDAVMAAIRRLREKIEPDPGHPRLLVTVRGLGYRLLPGGGDR